MNGDRGLRAGFTGFDEGIRRLTEEWRDSLERPRLNPDVLGSWARLIDAWLDEAELPLLLRVSKGNRGEVVQHHTGRALVCTDNSPANWALSSALQGRTPTLAEVYSGLDAGHIPVAFALTAAERAVARYKGTQRTKMDPPNLNTLGWKVCHIVDIGLNDPTSVTRIPLERLARHFRQFLHPRNMFVMPKDHSGLAESQLVQTVFRNSIV